MKLYCYALALGLFFAVETAAAETITLVCNVTFERCTRAKCLTWEPIFTIDTDANSVSSNNQMYSNEPETYTDLEITPSEIKFYLSSGFGLHTISRINGTMIVDLSDSGLAKLGNLKGKCTKGAAQF